MNLIILIGAPGSGKGTQSQLMSNSLDYPVICIGDIVRQEMNSKTELGKEMIRYIETGDLVPSDLINKIFLNKFNSLRSSKGLILDGFPRTVDQAVFLNEVINGLNIRLNIFFIDVPDEVLIKRLTYRSRADDKEEIIINRLNTYNLETKPLLTFYKHLLNTVNGNDTEKNVQSKLIACIN
ncbi:adenylate kinase [Candidatus Marinamargulisbacteria bacterium SCGC AG-343-D04]|nr:adenylate kinase [Candidatus Marinamargulisbacteria bacterium SCGC AG-343-D04]